MVLLSHRYSYILLIAYLRADALSFIQKKVPFPPIEGTARQYHLSQLSATSRCSRMLRCFLCKGSFGFNKQIPKCCFVIVT